MSKLQGCGAPSRVGLSRRRRPRLYEPTTTRRCLKQPLAAAKLALFCCAAVTVHASEHDHRYKRDDALSLWVNKVGPYHNPQETYVYYSLPFCSSKPVDQLPHRTDYLGEMLEGNDLIESGVSIKFRETVEEHTLVCAMTLTEGQAAQFSNAVRKHFWYQWILDDLPLWGMVGELTAADGEAADADEADAAAADPNAEVLIFTHKHLSISYNGPRVIHVNLTSDDPVAIAPGARLEFTYSVDWVASDTPYERRFERYLDYDFFEHEIHWFSVINSFMMVFFLVCIVTLILMRTLRKDFSRYAAAGVDVEELDLELEESGWKQVHGDVFRAPAHLDSFAALVGTGAQLAAMSLVMILFANASTLYMGRGAIVVSFLIAYALTSLVSGYVSGALYAAAGGRRWVRTLLLTASAFPALCLSCTLALNVISLWYGSLATVHAYSVASVSLLWLVVALPMCALGTILGRNWSGAPTAPCRVNSIPRLIPEKRWYARPAVLIALGGMLPFGSIFIEMYFVFTSFWHYKFYYVYGFMLLVFLILAIVCACVSVVITYFLLNNEDYLWAWTSFLASSSTGAYVFLYAIYYFFTKTRMTGTLQTSFFFAYMSVFCLGLGLLCGTIGYTGTRIFVYRIFQRVKAD